MCQDGEATVHSNGDAMKLRILYFDDTSKNKARNTYCIHTLIGSTTTGINLENTLNDA